MADDIKRTEALKCWFTERELLDLSRQAAREDRKVGELVRVIVRRSLYGSVGVAAGAIQGANSGDEGCER